MDEEMNLFEKPMTEKEQLELSNYLDKLLIVYENEFFDLEDAEDLLYEFKPLYEFIKMLENRVGED